MSRAISNPDEMELMPAFEHEMLQGKVLRAASEDELREGLEKAFDYRGDVTITRKDGTKVTGYIFDRRSGTSLHNSIVRVIPANERTRISITFAEIQGLEFTGRDTAAGKSWEAWVSKYIAKKAAGETQIELTPEALD